MNNRKLYESIMKNIAKEVKKALNEDDLPDNFLLTDDIENYLKSVIDDPLKLFVYSCAENFNFNYKDLYKDLKTFLEDPKKYMSNLGPLNKMSDSVLKKYVENTSKAMSKYLQTEESYKKVIIEIRKLISDLRSKKERERYNKGKLMQSEYDELMRKYKDEELKEQLNRIKVSHDLLNSLIDANVKVKFKNKKGNFTTYNIKIGDDGNIYIIPVNTY